jgi:hypothetical protein
LGDLVDAVKEGFDGVDGDVRKKVKWVAIESCREDELEADGEDVKF